MTELTHGGRKPLLKALVGSHNYNLNTPESDKDYKIFVMPLFSDLYSGIEFCNNKVSDTVDYDIHDVRRLEKLLFKANVNFLEVLFSTELEILVPETDPNYVYLKAIIDTRDSIATMNLKYLYESCVGMHIQRKRKMCYAKPDAKFLYDTKSAMTSYRILDFLERFKNTGDFKKAIWYNEEEKQQLLNIRNGVYSLPQIESILETKLKVIETTCRDYYVNSKVDELTNGLIKSTLSRMILSEIINNHK